MSLAAAFCTFWSRSSIPQISRKDDYYNSRGAIRWNNWQGLLLSLLKCISLLSKSFWFEKRPISSLGWHDLSFSVLDRGERLICKRLDGFVSYICAIKTQFIQQLARTECYKFGIIHIEFKAICEHPFSDTCDTLLNRGLCSLSWSSIDAAAKDL